MKLWITSAIALALALICQPAAAQSVGGNVSIAATGTSANIQLPASITSYQYVVLEYSSKTTTNEIFYKLGKDNTVTAIAPSLPTTQGSPALPANGICVNIGPNSWIAAITDTSTGTLRVTQLNVCPTK